MLATAIAGAGIAGPAMAATYTVDPTNQSDLGGTCAAPASGTCSLRQLIDYENGIATPSPRDTIVVPAGSYFLTGGELLISQSMSIVGAGPRATLIEQTSGGGGRVFDIGIPEGGPIPNVAISGLRIADGSVTFDGIVGDSGFGGDVRNLATLTLDRDWITGGTSSGGSGGGISNEGGTMTISNSLVSGNASVFTGSGGDSGAIENFGPNPITQTAGHLSILNSTLAGNAAALGGGVFSWCGGAGSCSSSGAGNTTTIVNSTIANNDGGVRGTAGGGLLVTQGTLAIQNSIVAFNTVDNPTASTPSNCAGAISTAGHNLDSGSDCGFHATGDMSGTNPEFTSSAPQNNGGDTDTLGLSAASPAVDAIPPGTSGCGGTDQRATSRPQGSGCDIGAYELFQPQEGSAFSAQVALAPINVTGPITINWGDGSSSTGTLASGLVGPILGSHTYAQAGIYNGTVTWTDAKHVNRSPTFSMKVADAPLSVGATAIAARAGVAFSGSVGMFTDANPLASTADYSATINWGDGTTSPAAVAAASTGFAVSGSHTYANPAVYTTTVTIFDVGGASAQARGVANVIAVHATSTLVGCSPTTVAPGRSTTCTATVTDDGPGTGTTPTGTITFSTGGADKLRSGGRCDLGGSGGSASCAVSFTPGRTQSNTPILTASYGGDFGHTGSSGSTTVAPVAGMTANVAVLEGTVLISLPRHTPRSAGAGPTSSSYVPLKGQGTIPVGATIDATNGTVMLATAADYHGALDRRHRIQTGIFSAAIFTIEQLTAKQQAERSHRKATGTPPTNLRLITPAATAAGIRCHPNGPPGRAIVRELSARANGFFRVIAAASVTIVRNAQWTVEDRCDGTLTGVGRGSATVTFLQHHRPVSKLVKAGGALLVSQRFPVPPPPIVVKGIPLPPGA
jgi:hypothetical protein